MQIIRLQNESQTVAIDPSHIGMISRSKDVCTIYLKTGHSINFRERNDFDLIETWSAIMADTAAPAATQAEGRG